MELSDRYDKGWEKLKEIHGETGEKVINSLKEISIDLVRFIVEHAYGDIYTREGLDLKSKIIVVVASLTAIGTAQPQLKVHINAALNIGVSIDELKEVILQMAVYCGFPNCLNGMNALKDVLKDREERGIKVNSEPVPTNAVQFDKQKIVENELLKQYSKKLDKLTRDFGDLSPELLTFLLEFGNADIWSRDNLDKKYRHVATIAALTALGNSQAQLKFHINAGLNNGLTEENIKELMILISLYTGFPSAINGTNSLKEVLIERRTTS